MHLVIFDIDGTLTDTNLVDGECYWRAVSTILGLSGEQPDWSDFRDTTDVGIAAELCMRHLGRQLSSAEIEAIGGRLAALLDVALVCKTRAHFKFRGLPKSSRFSATLRSLQLHWRPAG